VIIQVVTFESELPEKEVMAVAKSRIDEFRALPGLVQKYYVKLQQPNRYGGVYLWDSMASLAAYRESDLAKSIPQAYKIKGTPTVEILDALFPLRESA
jgi:heme-degrading monooxygenase HmoA